MVRRASATVSQLAFDAFDHQRHAERDRHVGRVGAGRPFGQAQRRRGARSAGTRRSSGRWRSSSLTSANVLSVMMVGITRTCGSGHERSGRLAIRDQFSGVLRFHCWLPTSTIGNTPHTELAPSPDGREYVAAVISEVVSAV